MSCSNCIPQETDGDVGVRLGEAFRSKGACLRVTLGDLRVQRIVSLWLLEVEHVHRVMVSGRRFVGGEAGGGVD